MKRYTYAAICERGEDGYGAYFPDLPGCVTAADTLEDLAEMAKEALELHLEGLLDDGVEFPQPTPLNQLAHDPAVTEAGVFLVTAAPRGGQVLLSLPEAVLNKVDAAASQQGQTRESVLSDEIERLFPAK